MKRSTRLVSLFLAIVMVFSLASICALSASAEDYTYVYYPKCKQSTRSIVDGLKEIGEDSSYTNRKKIAQLNQIGNPYSGTASQNTEMLNRLKRGVLIKSKTPVNDWTIELPSTATVTKGKTITITAKFKGSGISSCTLSNGNTAIVSTSLSTEWKPAGQYCTSTITVTAKKAGTVTLTFTLNGTKTLSKSVKVSVTEQTSTTNKLEQLKQTALANWKRPVRKSILTVVGTGRAFGASRSGGRKHAGIDWYVSNGNNTPVYAMESGKVVEYCANFYGGLSAVAIQHSDGSVARYCEIRTSLRKGDNVTKGQEIGKIKKNNIDSGTMLHLEVYMGTASGSFTNRDNKTYDWVTGNYQRRRDLVDPTFLLNLQNW